jgi:hypothetical protein
LRWKELFGLPNGLADEDAPLFSYPKMIDLALSSNLSQISLLLESKLNHLSRGMRITLLLALPPGGRLRRSVLFAKITLTGASIS